MPKVEEFSTFASSVHVSINQNAVTQPQLANEMLHEYGTASKHVVYLCNKQEEMFFFFGMIKEHQKHYRGG